MKWSKILSVVSNSLRPHGLHTPWTSPGQNTGVGSPSRLQGIFPTKDQTQGSRIAGRFFYQLSHSHIISFLIFLCFTLYMCVCVYMYVYIYLYICIYIHFYIHTYICIYIHIYIYTHTHKVFLSLSFTLTFSISLSLSLMSEFS